jgi:AcrR family transcriptional regulator
VLAAAEDLADDVGLARLTLAELAHRLGVRLPSLYKHVAGMDALQRQLAVRAKLALADVLGRAAVGRSGDDAVHAMARAYRAWAGEHPGRYAATVRAARPGEPSAADDEAAGAAATTVVLDVIAGYGLGGADAVDAARAIRSALHGFVTLEADHGFGMPVDVDRSFERLVDALCRGLGSWADSLADGVAVRAAAADGG